ncbi:hypothetical protein BDW59DRAFT_36327 [Aspergillus cavernicola]|uniref:BZIP domain-containing protein n=1 Tax=Aspergillus cavernicola TaxID=176166 RepID=A0ABR4HBU3_9EURO
MGKKTSAPGQGQKGLGMSKLVDSSATVRIRDNQRRSRERHKEYVRELEQRLRNYERLGVTATQEVQAVGRKMAQENQWLRSLLNLHGVPKPEVNQYLQSRRSEVAPPLAATSDPHESHVTRHPGFTSAPALEQYTQQGAWMSESIQSRPVHNTWPFTKVDELTQTSSPLPSQKSSLVQPAPKESAAISERGPVHLGLPRTVERDDDTSMSCEAAASIIAGMQNYPDASTIRDKLGCASAECRVRNMTIFEMLDV